MKRLFLLAVSFLALSCSAAWIAASQMDSAQSASSEATGRKIKVKGVKSIERDKSKPVRRAIEAWYDRNIEAFNAKDVAAIMALRTDDFHTMTPDGRVNTRADMETYTRRLLARIDHFLSQEFQIGAIDLQGNLASAEVTQQTVRMQRLPDNTLHKVEADAVQRETWKLTAAGWKLYKVDDVRSTGLFVDDKPYKPASQ
jgi:ketosteroid isomerase-like protein